MSRYCPALYAPVAAEHSVFCDEYGGQRLKEVPATAAASPAPT
jgi:hypothetical protein